MIYTAATGSILSDEKAQRYGERIALLVEEKDGAVTPAEIVCDAERKVSPLHDFFEWDNKTAATMYRVDQARYLLRSIHVVIKQNDHEQEQRAFYNVVIKSEATEEDERVYVHLDRVLGEEDLRQQVIAQALAKLVTWQAKYKLYKESVLAPIFAVIDQLVENVSD